MKTYTVEVPITGYLVIGGIEAESEAEAIDAALSHPNMSLDQIEEWEAHRTIVQGNVFYGTRNTAEAYCEDDES